MKLQCSQCNYIGEKNEFLVPSDITPPNYCKCPRCDNTNEKFYIVKIEYKEIGELDKFLKWFETEKPRSFMGFILRTLISSYRSSLGSAKT